MEQILITYSKTDDNFLLFIVNNGIPTTCNEETPEVVEIVNKIKNIINQ